MTEPVLLPEHIRALRRAIEAVMDQRGAEAMLAGADGTWAPGLFVRIGGNLVIAEHLGRGKPGHYVAYELGETELDTLDDAQMLFVLQQECLTPVLNPHVWYGRLLAAIDAALAPEPVR